MTLPLFIIVPMLLMGCEPDSSNQRKLKEEKLLNTSTKNQEALEYCIANGFNTEYCFMVDLSVHSGLNRFYVWGLKNNKALDSGLVAHGSCRDYFKNSLTEDDISNVSESHCSSIGKYKVGDRAYSNWGINIKYWIEGLENTNNKAVSRVVVLHSWEVIDNEEIYPNRSAESWGCPAVSDNYMKRLDTRLKQTYKPVLLWIYL